MPSRDAARSELTVRVVYWGPGLSGRTTNLQYLYARTAEQQRTRMTSLATESSRVLSFELVPSTLAPIDGFRVRVQLSAVPGSVLYLESKRSVLASVDAVVFVADSQNARSEANAEALEELRELLAERGISLTDLGFVLQLNKRDCPDTCTLEEGEQLVGPSVPVLESCAHEGWGVFDALKCAVHPVYKRLRSQSIEDHELPSSERALQALLAPLRANRPLGTEALGALRAALCAATRAPQPRVRSYAVRSLAAFSSDESTAALEQVLRGDELRSMRWIALDALATQWNARSLALLTEACGNEDAAFARRAGSARERLLRAYTPGTR